jgi:hypothetical protein
MHTSVALSELKVGDEIGIVSERDIYHGLTISEVSEEDDLPWVAGDDCGRRVMLTLKDEDGYELFFIRPGARYSIAREGSPEYLGVVSKCWVNQAEVF